MEKKTMIFHRNQRKGVKVKASHLFLRLPTQELVHLTYLLELCFSKEHYYFLFLSASVICQRYTFVWWFLSFYSLVIWRHLLLLRLSHDCFLLVLFFGLLVTFIEFSTTVLVWFIFFLLLAAMESTLLDRVSSI